MDNREYMKTFGEWLCSIAPDPMVKSLIRDTSRTMYERDYVIITNLCNGFVKNPPISISIKTLDGAKERYKEFNKAVLEVSLLSEYKKNEVSTQIDINAEKLKQHWMDILRKNGIKIHD